MKQLKFLFSALMFLTVLSSGQAQNYNNNNAYDAKTPGYWILGLNAGLAYQSSDVDVNFDGWGVGLTLGKNLYYSPSSNLSFDLRGRMLYDISYGQDNEAFTGILSNDALNGTDRGNPDEPVLNYLGSGGLVFNNHRTEKFELALEGVINFEKLKREKNIHLALYGGIGIDWYKASIDQAGEGDALYAAEYAQAAANGSDVGAIYDGVYETTADGNDKNGQVAFMPAVGFELGYWLTPKFAFGIGHKFTWAMNDLLDGQQWTANNELDVANDIHHYTNLNLKFILDKKERRLAPPVITLVEPGINPYTTDRPDLYLRATIENVASLADVRYTVNGNNSRSFTFSPNREIFTSNVQLRRGKNTITIYASNPSGEDQETLTVYYEEAQRPIVDITNPNGYKTVTEGRYELEGRVQNIVRDREISLTVNGRAQGNFSFDASSDILKATLDLEAGNNKIVLSAENNAGKARDEVTIRYDKPADLPAVTITRPSDSPSEVNTDRLNLEARIDNISSRNDISLKVNGRGQSNFDYRNGRLSANINLYEGENTIRVEANNRDGSDYDEVTVVYTPNQTPPSNPNDPKVDITYTSRPVPDRTNSNNATSEVQASISNVNYRGDIEYYVNGRRVYRFDFNENTGAFQALATVQKGNNTVLIKAKNADGEGQDEAAISYSGGNGNPPPPPPTYKNPPTVEITSPRSSYSNTDRQNLRIEARLQNVSRKSDISFRVNGRAYNNFSYSVYNGRFNADVQLRDGNNEIEIAARNKDGNDNARATIRFRGKQMLAPNVRITNPRNGTNFDESRVSIQARIDNIDNKNQIEFTQNGRRSSAFSFNPYNKSFSASIVLKEGANAIRIVAQNQGGSDSDQITIRYAQQPSIPKPSVEITSTSRPAATPMNPSKMRSTVKATIKNVRTKSNIKFYVNGRQNNNFNFNTANGAFSAIVDLKPGINRVKITAKNESGSDTDEANITTSIATPQRPPSVSFVSPQNNSTSKVERISIRARVDNVSEKRNLDLRLNGSKITTFNYNKGTLTAALNLRKGANTIALSASNKDGKDEASLKVNFASATNTAKPTISLLFPKKSGTTIKIPRYTVKAKIANVTKKSDISFVLNGKNGNFSFSNGVLSATVLLRKGKNTFNITAKNSAGSASKASDINYSSGTISSLPINKPKVEITSTSRPATTPMNPSAARSRVKAKIRNIKSKEQIKFTVNNKTFKNFEYNPKTGDFSILASLSKGENVIKIVATNGRFKAEDTVTITF